MRDSPVAAFSFLIAMIVIPFALGLGAFWWLLQYTNSGLLVFKKEVVAAASAKTGGEDAETVLHCSYFTGSRVLHREFSSEDSSTEGEEARPAVSCPWRIEAS